MNIPSVEDERKQIQESVDDPSSLKKGLPASLSELLGCKEPCTEYSGLADEDGALTEHCGPAPLPEGATEGDYNGCVGRTRARYQQLGPHCEVVRRVESGVTTGLGVAAVYTIAAGVCATACAARAAKIALELTGAATFGSTSVAAQALEAVEKACEYGSYGAAAADAAGTLMMTIEGKPWEQWWMIPVYGPGAAGSLAMAGVAVGAQTVGKEAGNKLAQEGARKIGGEMARGQAQDAVFQEAKDAAGGSMKNIDKESMDMVKDAAQKEGEDAAKQGGDKAADEAKDMGWGELAASCISAASLGIAAIAKAATLGVAAGVGAASCIQIAQLQGWGGVKPEDSSSSKSSGAFTDMQGAGSLSGSSVDGGEAMPQAYSANIPESTDDNHPFYSGALGDPGGKIFKSLPNRNRLGPAAKQAFNITPRSVGRRIAAGETPGQILAGLNGMNSGLGNAFRRLDHLAAEGKISGKGFGVDAGTYRGGGGGGGDSGGDGFNPMAMMQGFMDQLNPQGKNAGPTDIKGVKVVGMAYQSGRTADQISENRDLSIFDRVSYRYLRVGGRMVSP